MAELITPGSGGNHYIPYEERTGKESVVYFTRDLSAEGLKKIFERVNSPLTGKVAIKLHTGEQHGPNIIPRPWVKDLINADLPDATIIETNTYYEGDRYTTEQHRETLKVNGWDFCPVDIMDEDGIVNLPIKSENGSPIWQWVKLSSITIRFQFSPTLKAMLKVDLEDPQRISELDVLMVVLEKQ